MSDLVEDLFSLLDAKDMQLTTAESCTGGLLGATLTDRAGASAFYERGFITYSNEAKVEMLDVSMVLINADGAVSAQVAEAMASGAIERSHAQIAVSITGVAGPEGGSNEKPVGTVYFGFAIDRRLLTHEKQHFDGDRKSIQNQSVDFALSKLIELLNVKA